MRNLAKIGELWPTLANPQRQIHKDIPDICQVSCEGTPTFTKAPVKVPAVCGRPSECAQVTSEEVTKS